jgi:hypothetical protein
MGAVVVYGTGKARSEEVNCTKRKSVYESLQGKQERDVLLRRRGFCGEE